MVLLILRYKILYQLHLGSGDGESEFSLITLDHVSKLLGFRVCPGRHLSNNALFLFVASVLHVFNIEPSTDGSGNPVPIEVKMTTGLIR